MNKKWRREGGDPPPPGAKTEHPVHPDLGYAAAFPIGRKLRRVGDSSRVDLVRRDEDALHPRDGAITGHDAPTTTMSSDRMWHAEHVTDLAVSTRRASSA